MGGFNPVGAPNTVCYPLGLVTTPQNAFWTHTANLLGWLGNSEHSRSNIPWG